MRLKELDASYSPQGEITIYLHNRGLDRPLIEEMLEFPVTSRMAIYGVNNQNFEDVLALVRYTKSGYDIPISIFYDYDLDYMAQLRPLVDVAIYTGAFRHE